MMIGPKMIAEREKRFADALVTDGLRMTHQRLEIIREIAGAEDHPDADEVLRRVRTRVPTLSQDTVYRALAVLVEHGLIARITTPRATRFDPDRSPHQHFICDSCGRLEDVGVDMVKVPESPWVVPGVGEVRTVYVQLCGTCMGCRS